MLIHQNFSIFNSSLFMHKDGVLLKLFLWGHHNWLLHVFSLYVPTIFENRYCEWNRGIFFSFPSTAHKGTTALQRLIRNAEYKAFMCELKSSAWSHCGDIHHRGYSTTTLSVTNCYTGNNFPCLGTASLHVWVSSTEALHILLFTGFQITIFVLSVTGGR